MARLVHYSLIDALALLSQWVELQTFSTDQKLQSRLSLQWLTQMNMGTGKHLNYTSPGYWYEAVKSGGSAVS